MDEGARGWTAQGHWWRPGGEASAVSGVLRVLGSGAKLELVGDLVEDHGPEGVRQVVSGVTVLGRDTNNRAITLLDAYVDRQHLDPSQRQDFAASTVLVGREHPPTETPFEACSFSVEGLAEWTEPHFRLLNAEKGTVLSEEQQSSHDQERITFPVAGGMLTLWSGIAEAFSPTTRTKEVKSSWYFEADTPASLDEIWDKVIRPLQCLHMLFTGEQTRVFDAHVVLPGDGVSPGEQVRLKVHAGWNGVTSDVQRRPWEWPVLLQEIVDDLPVLADAWLRLYQQVGFGLAYYFVIVGRERELYLQNRYLSVVQAAEAFHRHNPRFAQRILDEDEHERRLDLLRLATQGTGWWNDWLRPRLRFAYEPTLRTRLKDLVSLAGDFGRQILPPSELHEVVETRNDLVHVLESRDSDDYFLKLVVLEDKVTLLLAACLLIELGIGEERARALLLRNPHNRITVQQEV